MRVCLGRPLSLAWNNELVSPFLRLGHRWESFMFVCHSKSLTREVIIGISLALMNHGLFCKHCGESAGVRGSKQTVIRDG
jgi:hypothetical protein